MLVSLEHLKTLLLEQNEIWCPTPPQIKPPSAGGPTRRTFLFGDVSQTKSACHTPSAPLPPARFLPPSFDNLQELELLSLNANK